MTSPDAAIGESAIFSPSRGFFATIRKYTKILRASLVERMTYRVDFILGTLFRFLPILTTILLWRAIYAGASGGGGPNQSVLSGFTYREMIAYLLLTNISRIFSSMPGLAAGIARDIREGTIKRYLIQPVDMIGYLLSYRIAHKLAYIVGSSIPYAILFVLCRNYFDGFPDPLTFLGFLVSCVLAFLIGFFFDVCVGLVGFWFLEVTSLLYIVMTLNFFISGHMLPLDLLPQPWSGLLKALPFQYMAYYPAVIFQGKVKGMDLVVGLLTELMWAGFFILLARWLFRQGLRRYSAFGG
ncbi:MAG TPA: ABC-2 family transporter protein [Isosphaeraceae bacterium]